MNIRYFSAFALAVPLLLTGCDNMGKQQSIAWVDYAQLLENSAPGLQEKSHNNEVKTILLKAKQSVQETYTAMDKDKAARSQLADTQMLNKQWLLEQRQARQKTMDVLNKSITDYLEKNHLRAILPKEEAVAVAPDADITQIIIDKVKDVKVDYGKLPEVTIKKEAPVADK